MVASGLHELRACVLYIDPLLCRVSHGIPTRASHTRTQWASGTILALECNCWWKAVHLWRRLWGRWVTNTHCSTCIQQCHWTVAGDTNIWWAPTRVCGGIMCHNWSTPLPFRWWWRYQLPQHHPLFRHKQWMVDFYACHQPTGSPNA